MFMNLCTYTCVEMLLYIHCDTFIRASRHMFANIYLMSVCVRVYVVGYVKFVCAGCFFECVLVSVVELPLSGNSEDVRKEFYCLKVWSEGLWICTWPQMCGFERKQK